jgi:hypothetical protein
MIQTQRTTPKKMMKGPTPAKVCDLVGQSLPKTQRLLEFFPDIFGQNFVLLETVDHFLVERRQFADSLTRALA